MTDAPQKEQTSLFANWVPTYCTCGNPSGRSFVTSPIDTCDSCSDCGNIIGTPEPYDPFKL